MIIFHHYFSPRLKAFLCTIFLWCWNIFIIYSKIYVISAGHFFVYRFRVIFPLFENLSFTLETFDFIILFWECFIQTTELFYKPNYSKEPNFSQYFLAQMSFAILDIQNNKQLNLKCQNWNEKIHLWWTWSNRWWISDCVLVSFSMSYCYSSEF